MSRLLLPILLALIAAGYSGCGGDDEPASDAKPAGNTATTSTADASDGYAPPPLAELKQLSCADLSFASLTHTTTIYFVSALARETGTEADPAFRLVEEICLDSKESTKPWNRAARELRG